jgi:hypothetical protein
MLEPGTDLLEFRARQGMQLIGYTNENRRYARVISWVKYLPSERERRAGLVHFSPPYYVVAFEDKGYEDEGESRASRRVRGM